MNNLGYTHTPSVQITVSGNVTATLDADTLIITSDSRQVHLDDGTTQVSLYYFQTRSVNGYQFANIAALVDYIEFLAIGGEMVAPSKQVDIIKDGQNVTISGLSGTFTAATLSAMRDRAGQSLVSTFTILQNDEVLLKGISVPLVTYNGIKLTKYSEDLVTFLNEEFTGQGDVVVGDVEISDVTGLQNALDAKADLGHSHNVSDITGLQDAIETAVDAAAAGEDNVNADWNETDPAEDSFILNKPTLFDGDYNSLTNLPTLFDGQYSSLTGLPSLFDGTWNSLSGKPSTFTPSSHTHEISEVNGLQAALNNAGDANVQSDWNETNPGNDAFIQNKPAFGSASLSAATDFAAAGHTHTHDDITDFDTEVNALISAAGAGSGEDNVQSDWNEADNTSDAFILNKPTLFDGNYNSLTNLPTLFDGAYSSLSGLPTLFDGAYSSLTGLPTLFSGSYNDLTDKPTLFDGAYGSLTGVPSTFTPAAHTHTTADITDITGSPVSGEYLKWDGTSWVTDTPSGTGTGEVNVQADWNETDSADDAFILNKPTLFSGAYADLTGAPTLFDGAYGSLTGVPATFAPSAHTHTASEITDFDTEVGNNTAVAANTAKTSFPGFGTTAGTALEGNTALFSGAYADLTGKPTLFDGDYNSLTNLPSLFSGAYADLSGLPTLFSGSYNDLTDKPTLFDGAYGSLTGTPDLTVYVPYANASGDVDLNNKNLDGVATITSAAALFGNSPQSLRAFNIRGTGFDGRLSLQGSSGDNPGIEMTTDGNTTRVLQRLQEVGTSGTSLETYTQVDGGGITLKATLDDDGTFYLHNTNSKDTGIRNSSGTMQFKNSSGSWTDMGSGSGSIVQADWDETDNTSDTFIRNKPTIPTRVGDLVNDAGYYSNVVVVQPSYLRVEMQSTHLAGGASQYTFNPASWTKVAGLDEEESVGSLITWDVTNTRIEVTQDGLYTFSLNAFFESTVHQRPTPTGSFYVNGVQVAGRGHAYVRTTQNANEGSSNLTRTLNLSAGDYVEVYFSNQGHVGTAQTYALDFVIDVVSHTTQVTLS